jgi:hypothetical protein
MLHWWRRPSLLACAVAARQAAGAAGRRRSIKSFIDQTELSNRIRRQSITKISAIILEVYIYQSTIHT